MRTEERLVQTLENICISSKNIFHNLYVEKYNGKFSQIDTVILTEVGIIVIEVKNYSGWIFGNGNYREWTQVLAYGKEKYKFYNPIKQNSTHISELRKQLRTVKNFYSVIVFYGDCEFKKLECIPKNVHLIKNYEISSSIREIINNNEKNVYPNETQIRELLQTYAENGKDEKIRNQHIKYINSISK